MERVLLPYEEKKLHKLGFSPEVETVVREIWQNKEAPKKPLFHEMIKEMVLPGLLVTLCFIQILMKTSSGQRLAWLDVPILGMSWLGIVTSLCATPVVICLAKKMLTVITVGNSEILEKLLPLQAKISISNFYRWSFFVLIASAVMAYAGYHKTAPMYFVLNVLMFLVLRFKIKQVIEKIILNYK